MFDRHTIQSREGAQEEGDGEGEEGNPNDFVEDCTHHADSDYEAVIGADSTSVDSNADRLPMSHQPLPYTLSTAHEPPEGLRHQRFLGNDDFSLVDIPSLTETSQSDLHPTKGQYAPSAASPEESSPIGCLQEWPPRSPVALATSGRSLPDQQGEAEGTHTDQMDLLDEEPIPSDKPKIQGVIHRTWDTRSKWRLT